MERIVLLHPLCLAQDLVGIGVDMDHSSRIDTVAVAIFELDKAEIALFLIFVVFARDKGLSTRLSNTLSDVGLGGSARIHVDPDGMRTITYILWSCQSPDVADWGKGY
jgi:hypothetical protein